MSEVHKYGHPDDTSNMTITTHITTNKNDETIWSNEMDKLELCTNNINNISSKEDIL